MGGVGAFDDGGKLGISHGRLDASRANASRTDANFHDVCGAGNQQFLYHLGRGDVARHDSQVWKRLSNPFDPLDKVLRIAVGGVDTNEADIRVPMIAVWPQVVAPATRTDAMVSGTDFVATLAAIAQVPLSEEQARDSKNLLPHLHGDVGVRRRELLLQGGSRHELVFRQGPWKLILQSNHQLTRWEPLALFDLAVNPREVEESNLINAPEQADRVTAMLNRYREIRDNRAATGDKRG